MSLCVFNSDGLCETCGYRTAIAGLIRNCAPPPEGGRVVKMFVPHPTAEDFAAIIGQRGEAISDDARPRGLGDMVAAGLDAIGITKKRVEAIIGGPCGCSERQGYINAAAAKWLGMSPGSTAPPEIDPGTP